MHKSSLGCSVELYIILSHDFVCAQIHLTLRLHVLEGEQLEVVFFLHPDALEAFDKAVAVQLPCLEPLLGLDEGHPIIWCVDISNRAGETLEWDINEELIHMQSHPLRKSGVVHVENS